MWRGKSKSRDMFGRRIPSDFRITFRRDVLAEVLWEYGEDTMAEAALQLGEDELHQVQLLAVWHGENDPEPSRRPKLTRIMARAMIEYVEGSPRDTKRQRRRTRAKDVAYDGAYHASLLRGAPLPSTPAENGLDLHD